jgi:hypothetical protein
MAKSKRKRTPKSVLKLPDLEQSRSAVLSSLTSPSSRRTYLESHPFPHYEPHPEVQGVLIRVDENGRRTAGRFVNRKFQPTKSPRKASAK